MSGISGMRLTTTETTETTEMTGADAVVHTWRLLYAHERWRVLWMLGAASTGLYITSAAWLSKRVVDSLIGADGGGVSSAMLFASLYALATLLHAIVGSYYAVRLLTIRDRFVSVADQLLMDKVASAWSLASVELPSARDRIRLASAGARSLPSVVSNSVEAGQHAITVLGVCLILGYFHPLVAMLVLVPSMPLFWSQLRVNAETFAALVHKSPAYRRMRYFIELMLGSAAAKEVRIYRTGPFFLDKYRSAADEVFATSRTRRRKAGRSMIGWGTVSAFGVGGAYIYIVYLASLGRITVGDVVMYISTVFYGGAAIRGLIQSSSTVMTSSLEAEIVLDVPGRQFRTRRS